MGATIRAAMGLRLRFHFYGELNDFLNASKRDVDFEHVAGATDTIKHVIESLGVPHTEIGQVMVNGQVLPLSERLTDGDCVHVLPHAMPVKLEHTRFVVDVHVGRLAAYLRMLGFDTWYDRFADDALLASVASSEQRVLLTRDAGLLKRREVQEGYYVRADKPLEQLREVSQRFALLARSVPFCRCMDCNGHLRPVSKEEVADRLPPHTRETKSEFSRCLDCGKVFWRGSHYARMLVWIEDLTAC